MYMEIMSCKHNIMTRQTLKMVVPFYVVEIVPLILLRLVCTYQQTVGKLQYVWGTIFN